MEGGWEQAPDGHLVAKDDVMFVGPELDAGGHATGRTWCGTGSGIFTLDNVEHVSIATGGGSDTVSLQNLRFDTDVRSVAVDLANPAEHQTGDRDRDTVFYDGRDDAGDSITLTTALGETMSSILPPAGDSAVSTSPTQVFAVKLTDNSSHHLMEVTVVNTDPAYDVLRLQGKGGDDHLTVLEPEATAPTVTELVHVVLIGGTGEDTLTASYRVAPPYTAPRVADAMPYAPVDIYGGTRSQWTGNPIDDSATDVFIVNGERWSSAPIGIAIDNQGQSVQISDASDSLSWLPVQQINCYSIDDFQLNLGTAPVDNTVQLTSGIAGKITVHDGPYHDRFYVAALETAGAKTIMLDGGGMNTVTLGHQGTVDAVKRLTVLGGAGDDTLIYDSSADDAAVSLQVDSLVSAGRISCRGTEEQFRRFLACGLRPVGGRSCAAFGRSR